MSAVLVSIASGYGSMCAQHVPSARLALAALASAAVSILATCQLSPAGDEARCAECQIGLARGRGGKANHACSAVGEVAAPSCNRSQGRIHARAPHSRSWSPCCSCKLQQRERGGLRGQAQAELSFGDGSCGGASSGQEALHCGNPGGLAMFSCRSCLVSLRWVGFLIFQCQKKTQTFPREWERRVFGVRARCLQRGVKATLGHKPGGRKAACPAAATPPPTSLKPFSSAPPRAAAPSNHHRHRFVQRMRMGLPGSRILAPGPSAPWPAGWSD